MQTEHYMSNMGKPGRAEQRGLERVDDLAGREQRQVVAALGLAPGRSAEAGPGGGRTQSELLSARSPDDGRSPPEPETQTPAGRRQAKGR